MWCCLHFLWWCLQQMFLFAVALFAWSRQTRENSDKQLQEEVWQIKKGREPDYLHLIVTTITISSRYPCCDLLPLSWNTNENPTTDKLSSNNYHYLKHIQKAVLHKKGTRTHHFNSLTWAIRLNWPNWNDIMIGTFLVRKNPPVQWWSNSCSCPVRKAT